MKEGNVCVTLFLFMRGGNFLDSKIGKQKGNVVMFNFTDFVKMSMHIRAKPWYYLHQGPRFNSFSDQF